jgi:SAM-dependent methyltransferase
MPVALTTADYARDCLRTYSLRYWLVGGPDYSRAVEYPLVSRLLEVDPGQELLDVGAGRRADFARLMAQRGVEVTAIDEREDVGADARPQAGLRVLRADARRLSFDDGSFDRVAAISTVEHIEKDEPAAMKELARVLAPGGRLVVTVPYNPLKRAELFSRDAVYGRTGDRVFFAHIYDDEALEERIVRPTGLRVVERLHLGEPGLRMSRLYYAKEGRLGRLRWLLPVGWAMGLTAPRFLREVAAEQIHYDDWLGVAAVLVFEK